MENLLLEALAQHDIYLLKHGSSYRRRKNRLQIARNYKHHAKVSSLLRTLKQQNKQGVQPVGANHEQA